MGSLNNFLLKFKSTRQSGQPYENRTMKEKRRIITFSRRTDPSVSMDWFLKSIEHGFCDVPNPINGKPYRVSLLPSDVLLLTYWTKNPSALIPYLDKIKSSGFTQVFFITLTGYPSFIEQNVPDKEKTTDAIKEICVQYSSRAITWRYDPIVISSKRTHDWHIQNFTHIARSIEGCASRVIVSVAHIDGSYSKCRSSLGSALSAHNDELSIPQVNAPEYPRFYDKTIALLTQINRIAADYGLGGIEVCCSPAIADGERSSVKMASCLSNEFVRANVPDAEEISVKGTRSGSTYKKLGYGECGCLESVDIGTRGSCTLGCVYCYARK